MAAQSGERGERRRRAGGDRADVYRLARSGGEVAGEIDARTLARLAAVLDGDQPSVIRYVVRGAKDEHGRPALDVSVIGEVHVACQRCLAPMPMPLEHETLLVVASSEAEAAVWDRDEHEVAIADHPVPVTELVEDEVLLALPYAPRHPEGECAAEAGAGGG
jgi:uncharacterized protein